MRKCIPRFFIVVAILFLTVQCPGDVAPQLNQVAMQDGTKLATDVYVAPGDVKPYPVILLRSTYGRKLGDAQSLLKRGYAVVVQDVRGMGDSEGEHNVFYADGWRPDQHDGKDTVDWIKKQPWCNGKIGTMGGSALALTQLLMAPATDGITYQAIEVGGSSFYGNLTFIGGVFLKNMCEGWLTAIKEPERIDYWKSHPAYDEFWPYYNMEPQAPKITAPALLVGGWYDIFQKGTINSFLTRQNNGGPGAKGNQKLIMRWSPHGPDVTKDYALNENRFDLKVSEIRDKLIDHWLKGDAITPDIEPTVWYYTFGDDKDANAPGNEWRTADTWPPFPLVSSSYYLSANGVLDTTAPATAPEQQTFTYDPANPVPTYGGNNLLIPSGPFDQRVVSIRNDVLKFSSAPLSEPMEIDGNVQAKLYVSTDAPDTDFTAKLVDIFPEGDDREILMLDSIQRVKFRKTFEKPEPLLTSANEVVEINIDLWDMSWVFNKGHRIGLEISSSNYPRFEKNPNTGDDYPKTTTAKDAATGKDVAQEIVRVAQNTVHFGGEHLSALILPVRNLDVNADGASESVRSQWAHGQTKSLRATGK